MSRQLSARSTTTYSERELKRASQAPGKIAGIYDSMKGGLDSGFDSMPTNSSMEEDPPLPPKLLGVDRTTEHEDSGLGDDAEADRVAVDKRSPTLEALEKEDNNMSPNATEPLQKPAVSFPRPHGGEKHPRKPRKTIAPAAATKMNYTTPQQVTEEQQRPSLAAHVPPQQEEADVQRLHLQNQWQRILFQQQIHYLLPNRDGDTGIHLAVIHSRPDILTQLLSLVASEPRLRIALDEQNSLYQTALHIATHTQQIDMIQKLLSSGASLELTDHKGNTPLHIACRFSSTKCLEELVRGVPLERLVEAAYIRNHQGQTCVHIATERGNTDTLRKLKSIGIDMNVEDYNSGKTPLHIAVEMCSLTDVQFLAETCQADVNKTTYSGCTPLHAASGRGNIAVVAYLLSVGADPDLMTDEGDTALHLAGSEQVATILAKAAALRWLAA